MAHAVTVTNDSDLSGELVRVGVRARQGARVRFTEIAPGGYMSIEPPVYSVTLEFLGAGEGELVEPVEVPAPEPAQEHKPAPVVVDDDDYYDDEPAPAPPRRRRRAPVAPPDDGPK